MHIRRRIITDFFYYLVAVGVNIRQWMITRDWKGKKRNEIRGIFNPLYILFLNCYRYSHLFKAMNSGEDKQLFSNLQGITRIIDIGFYPHQHVIMRHLSLSPRSRQKLRSSGLLGSE